MCQAFFKKKLKKSLIMIVKDLLSDSTLYSESRYLHRLTQKALRHFRGDSLPGPLQES
jgi:hypothetical protein